MREFTEDRTLTSTGRGASPASLLVIMLVLAAAGCGSTHESQPTTAPATDPAAAEPAPEPPPPPGDYPSGPYGMAVGQTFPNITLQGYRAGAGAWTTIALKDYYDPDGAHGIKGLYLTGSAPWCSACVAEGRSLPDRFKTEYRQKGARFLTAIVQDESQHPATRATVDAWIAAFSTNYDIAADAAITVLPRDAQGNGSVALPYNYVIDPRTMKVVQINSGPFFLGGGIPGLDGLLAQ